MLPFNVPNSLVAHWGYQWVPGSNPATIRDLHEAHVGQFSHPLNSLQRKLWKFEILRKFRENTGKSDDK